MTPTRTSEGDGTPMKDQEARTSLLAAARRQLLRRPLLTSAVAFVLAVPSAVLGAVTLPHVFTPSTRISASQVNANFDALNGGKLDASRVIALIHTHTAADVDCFNDACTRLPAALQGIDNLVITATPLTQAGAGGGAEASLTQPIYVRKYRSGADSYYELMYGDGLRPFPLGLRVSILAFRN